MRRRNVVIGNFNDIQTENRNIQLEHLSEQDVRLLRAFIRAIPDNQDHYVQGSPIEIVLNSNIYRVTLNHGLRFIASDRTRIAVVELNDAGDVMHLGHLVSDNDRVAYQASSDSGMHASLLNAPTHCAEAMKGLKKMPRGLLSPIARRELTGIELFGYFGGHIQGSALDCPGLPERFSLK
jgi:hypothetical protein